MSTAITGRDANTGAINSVVTEEEGLRNVNYVWDTGTLAWVKMTQPVAGGGGDASAANQTTEIARLEAIRDRLPAALVGGRLDVAVGNSVAVTGPLTDAQLRAVAVPVSATNLDVRDLVAASDAVTVHGNVGVLNQMDLTNSNPAVVAIVDGAGTQITSFGGGTQYTETDTDASITGTAMLWEDTSDTLRSVSAAKPLPVNVVAGSGAGVTHDDDAAFTPGTSDGVPVFGFFDDTATDLVDEGDAGVVRMSKRRELLVAGDRAIPIYNALIPSQVHVAVANTVHWDLFNADAALIVRVLSIKQIPNITTAVTGVVFDWLLERTTSVGTGGSAITPWLSDLSDAALDADITCRSKPTGGAAASTDLRNYSLSSEETNAATITIASQGGLELIPDALQPWSSGKGIVLRNGQGIRCVQVTNSNAGNTGWLISFSVETA